MTTQLEDVGKVPGGGVLRPFLAQSLNDDGSLRGVGFIAPSPSGDTTGVTDAANLQAALNAASGRAVVLDVGTYQISTALSVPAGVKLLGPGESLCTIQRAAAIATPITVAGDNVTLEGFAVDGGLSSFPTNANHGISAQNVNHFRARRLLITNYQNSAILVNATSSRTNFDVAIENCRCDGGGVANNGFLIVNYDRPNIRGCRAENIQGASGPGYGCQIKNDSRWGAIEDCDAYFCTAGMAFGFDATTANGVISSRIVGCNTVSCDAGIVMGAASNNVVAGVNIWMTTNVNDAIRIQGKGDGTNGSVGNSISGVTVHGVGASRACVRFDDVSTDNMVTLDLVDASGATTATTTGSSDRNTVEVKKYANATAHELSSTSTGTQNRIRRVEDRRTLLDTSFGAITQSMDRGAPTVAQSLGSLVYYIPVYLQAGEVISNITFHVSAFTSLATNFFVGLYKSSGGAAVATSTDQAANVSATGQKTIALTSPFTVLDSGVYYVAVSNNAGVFSLLGLASSTSARLGSNPYPYAQDTAAAGASLPTMSLAAGTKALWVELS